MDIGDIKHAYFVGIGGIGMSGLARLFHRRGIRVSGSDISSTDLLNQLVAEGIMVEQGSQTGVYFDESVDRVIYSEAIHDTHPELEMARHRNISLLTYAQALGVFSKHYKTIAVCGAHGKSTTTSMLGLVFEGLGLDPTVLVGTKVLQFGGKNVRFGTSEWFIVEACEYRRSFLNLSPSAILVLNLDEEHLDYYRDFDDYVQAFSNLAQKVRAHGVCVVNGDSKGMEKVISNLDVKTSVFSESLPTADYLLQDKTVMHWGERLGVLDLKIPGRHNYLNALGVIAIVHQLGLFDERVIDCENSFRGSWRRFEYKGAMAQNVRIYDDYAHHPTEIMATLKAARELFPKRRIVCVFQPHQYSRTKKLFNKFMQAFSNADEVIIPNIYRVRDSEDDVKAVGVYDFVSALQQNHPFVRYGNGFENTIDYLRGSLNTGDVLITMGAGDVYQVGEGLLR